MNNYEFANVELNEETMQKMIAQLVIENADMKRKIDKAIEYIKQLEHSEWITFGRKILLEILQGKEQE